MFFKTGAKVSGNVQLGCKGTFCKAQCFSTQVQWCDAEQCYILVMEVIKLNTLYQNTIDRLEH